MYVCIDRKEKKYMYSDFYIKFFHFKKEWIVNLRNVDEVYGKKMLKTFASIWSKKDS